MQFPWRPLSRRPGRLPPRRRFAWPSATVCLLAAGAVGLAASSAVHRWGGAGAEATWRAWGGLSAGGLYEGRLWQPLTHLFLPGSATWLLLVELPIFFLAGRQLESIVGRRHLLALCLLAGAAGGLTQLGYGWLGGFADAPVLGLEAPALAVYVALACAVPEMELVPPLSLAWRGGSGTGCWRIKHGALAAVGAAAVVLGVGTVLSLRGREPWAEPEAARCLVAAVAACLYMRHLGFGRRPRPSAEDAVAAAWMEAARGDADEGEPVLAAPVAAAAGKLVVPRFTELERRMSAREYITERIDPILDKITRHGIGSLTGEERRTLEHAREKIARRR